MRGMTFPFIAILRYAIMQLWNMFPRTDLWMSSLILRQHTRCQLTNKEATQTMADYVLSSYLFFAGLS